MPLSHPKNSMVSLPPTTKKTGLWAYICMDESVNLQADASRNCHDPTHTKWCHQSLLPTPKKKVYRHIHEYVSEVP